MKQVREIIPVTRVMTLHSKYSRADVGNERFHRVLRETVIANANDDIVYQNEWATNCIIVADPKNSIDVFLTQLKLVLEEKNINLNFEFSKSPYSDTERYTINLPPHLSLDDLLIIFNEAEQLEKTGFARIVGRNTLGYGEGPASYDEIKLCLIEEKRVEIKEYTVFKPDPDELQKYNQRQIAWDNSLNEWDSIVDTIQSPDNDFSRFGGDNYVFNNGTKKLPKTICSILKEMTSDYCGLPSYRTVYFLLEREKLENAGYIARFLNRRDNNLAQLYQRIETWVIEANNISEQFKDKTIRDQYFAGYGRLFEKIEQLEQYGNSLKGKTYDYNNKSEKAIALAQSIRTTIDDVINGTTQKDVAAKNISKLIATGRKTMGQDRNWQDIIAHISAACAVVGIFLSLVSRLTYGTFYYLNNTKRQTLLQEIDEEVMRSGLSCLEK